MAISDRVLLNIRTKLEPLIGTEEADAMAEALRHPEWEHVATKEDVRALGVELRTETAGLRAETAGLRAETAGLRTETADLRAQVVEFRAEVRVEVARLRADITRDFHTALWASQAAVAGVVALVVTLAVVFS